MSKTSYILQLLAAGTALIGSAAPATTFVEQEFVCPIGGETFTAQSVASSSSFGARPDGRTYGTLPVYPIVECPENGFLLFQNDFTPEELEILGEAVASAEYQAMREVETPYYRAWWLQKAIGEDKFELANTLLVATWETDEQPEKKNRYQSAYVDAVRALPSGDPEKADFRFWLSLRAANVLRELRRFEEARGWFDELQATEVALDNEELDFVLDYIAAERMLIGERNAKAEPLTMMPDQMAVWQCEEDRSELTRLELQTCRRFDKSGADDEDASLAEAMAADAEANAEAAASAVAQATAEASMEFSEEIED